MIAVAFLAGGLIVVGIALTYYVFRLVKQRDRALAELERCLEEHRNGSPRGG